MNIVHLTASRFFGGPERQMLGLAEALPEDYSTSFVSFSEGGCCHVFLKKADEAGFKTIALKNDTPRLLAARRELTNVLRQLRADVLIPHGYKSNLIGLLAVRQLQIPIISVSHGWTWQCLKVRLYEALDRRILHWMDKVVCVSESQAQRVRRAGVAAEKCIVIHDAVRPERFDNPDPAFRNLLGSMFREPPELIVGSAGRLSPEKGFNILIDAAAQVLAAPGVPLPTSHCPLPTTHSPQSTSRCPLPTNRAPRVGFILFGDGPLRDALARQVAARGLEGKFILAGFRPDVDRFFPHLNVFVQSSFTEGLPNVVLEACAAGVPVVATAVGGTAEIIEDGVNGFLTPAGNSSALAAGIACIAADNSRRREIGERARHNVRERFSFPSQADAYVRLIEELLLPKTCDAVASRGD
ncbi:MAG: glycosyltransferase [Thermoguttaceae bacterium]